jgi:outer membrane protein OmpA-like peptidoglycan-associated protein
MKMRYSLLAFLLAISVVGYSQKKNTEKKEDTSTSTESSDNLVSDASFEVSDVKTLKAYNQLTTFLKTWMSPNQTSADLYNNMVKSTKVSIPSNDYGKEEPYDGSSYAGFRAYTKDVKKTRTYLQTKLKKKLEKDKLYCVRFNVSLADLSKFGVNNVGVFFSDRKVQNAHDNALTFQPQITEKTNKPIVTMQGWETICGTFLGTGKEEYILIGCFGLEDNLKLEKVKKPADIPGVIMAEAYYYLDKIEVVEVEAQSQCFCGKTEDRDPDLIYSRSVAKGIDMKPEQVVAATTVWYSFLSTEIPSMFEADLTELANIMKANTSMKIEIVGHSDTDEMNEAKVNRMYVALAESRANVVKKWLEENGVEASRMTIVSKDNTVLASSKTTPLGKAQNRRVEFVVQ